MFPAEYRTPYTNMQCQRISHKTFLRLLSQTFKPNGHSSPVASPATHYHSSSCSNTAAVAQQKLNKTAMSQKQAATAAQLQPLDPTQSPTHPHNTQHTHPPAAISHNPTPTQSNPAQREQYVEVSLVDPAQPTPTPTTTPTYHPCRTPTQPNPTKPNPTQPS